MPHSVRTAPRKWRTLARVSATIGVIATSLPLSACLLLARGGEAMLPTRIPVLQDGQPDTSCVIWSDGDREQVAPVGATVRVTLQTNTLFPTTGTVVAHSADSLAVMLVDSSVVRVNPLRIRSIERQVPLPSDSRIARGQWIGLAVGLTAGIVAATRLDGWARLAGFFGLPAMGGAAGGLAGGAIARRMPVATWQTVWGEEADVKMRAVRRSRGMCRAWPRA